MRLLVALRRIRFIAAMRSPRMAPHSLAESPHEKPAPPHIAALGTMPVWSLTFVCTKVLLGYMG